MQRPFVLATTLLLAWVGVSRAEPAPRVESNVVYGMYSGLALLMDVHHPPADSANQCGVVFIRGCGWHQPLAANADQLKEGGAIVALAKPLAKLGFTVFTVNHRAAPRFRYPAPLEDVQRAVQFVRYHHKKYGIARDRIAAVGGSSGGHLASLLGVLPSIGRQDASDPVERESSKVQCVVGLAPATHLYADDLPPITAGVVASFLGEPRYPNPGPNVYKLASPISHVSKDAAAFLLIHGGEDSVVPCSQSRVLFDKLKGEDAVAEYIEVEGVGHGIPPLVASRQEGTSPPEIGRWMSARLLP